MELDFERASRELIRAIRGERSQVALSRRLGYRSNVVYMWESGRRWPTATETLRAASLCRIDVRRALESWYRTAPSWLSEHPVDDPALVARFLQHEQGETPLVVLAERAGRNRYSVARWIRGSTEPRLPDFLRVVEAASLRVVDLIANLVGPEAVPAAAPLWALREARRNAALEEPWVQAVLRALELPELRTEPARLGPHLGLPPEVIARSVAILERAGQVRREGESLLPVASLALDTRRTEESARKLKGFWARVAAERLEAGAPGAFAYNLCTISRSQLARLGEMQQAYWRAVRAVVAEDEPPEVVVLMNLQLLQLSQAGAPAASGTPAARTSS